jgi:hypothetical protein
MEQKVSDEEKGGEEKSSQVIPRERGRGEVVIPTRGRVI